MRTRPRNRPASSLGEREQRGPVTGARGRGVLPRGTAGAAPSPYTLCEKALAFSGPSHPINIWNLARRMRLLGERRRYSGLAGWASSSVSPRG